MEAVVGAGMPTVLAAGLPIRFAPCPTCGGEVSNVEGEQPYTDNVEPLARQQFAAPTGPMHWVALPCRDRVLPTVGSDGSVVLSSVEP